MTVLHTVESSIDFNLQPTWKHSAPSNGCIETWVIQLLPSCTNFSLRGMQVKSFWMPIKHSDVSTVLREHHQPKFQKVPSTRAPSSTTEFKLTLYGWRCDPRTQPIEFEPIPSWWFPMQLQDCVQQDCLLMKPQIPFRKLWKEPGFVLLDPWGFCKLMNIALGPVTTSKNGRDRTPFNWWFLLDKHMNAWPSSRDVIKSSDALWISSFWSQRTTPRKASSMPWTTSFLKWIRCPMCRGTHPFNGLWDIILMFLVSWWKKNWIQLNYILRRPLRWSWTTSRLPPSPSHRPTMKAVFAEPFYVDTQVPSRLSRQEIFASTGGTMWTVRSPDPKSLGRVLPPLSWQNRNLMKYYGWSMALLYFEPHLNTSSLYYHKTTLPLQFPFNNHFNELNFHFNKFAIEEWLSMWICLNPTRGPEKKSTQKTRWMTLTCHLPLQLAVLDVTPGVCPPTDRHGNVSIGGPELTSTSHWHPTKLQSISSPLSELLMSKDRIQHLPSSYKMTGQWIRTKLWALNGRVPPPFIFVHKMNLTMTWTLRWERFLMPHLRQLALCYLMTPLHLHCLYMIHFHLTVNHHHYLLIYLQTSFQSTLNHKTLDLILDHNLMKIFKQNEPE